MNIRPNSDQELAILEAIKAGLIKSETDALTIGLQSLRERLTEQNTKANQVNVFPIKNNGQVFNRTPQQAASHMLESRKNNHLPDGITIHDLINEGRA
jgi:predicted component of type VI protein secretion system